MICKTWSDLRFLGLDMTLAISPGERDELIHVFEQYLLYHELLYLIVDKTDPCSKPEKPLETRVLYSNRRIYIYARTLAFRHSKGT